jgi:hypothetical protein
MYSLRLPKSAGILPLLSDGENREDDEKTTNIVAYLDATANSDKSRLGNTNKTGMLLATVLNESF